MILILMDFTVFVSFPQKQWNYIAGFQTNTSTSTFHQWQNLQKKVQCLFNELRTTQSTIKTPPSVREIVFFM